jgi:hypothetical protein
VLGHGEKRRQDKERRQQEKELDPDAEKETAVEVHGQYVLGTLRQGGAGLKGYGIYGAFRDAFAAAIAALPFQQNGDFPASPLLKTE